MTRSVGECEHGRYMGRNCAECGYGNSFPRDGGRTCPRCGEWHPDERSIFCVECRRERDAVKNIDPRAAIDTTPFAWDAGVKVPGEIPCEIDPTAYVGPFANVQSGNKRATKIGARCHVDAFVHVGHDVVIGDDSTVVAHTVICGHVTIGRNCYLGAGCVILQRLTIGDEAIVGAGAIVTKDVSPGAVVLGNPAKFYKWRKDL